MNTMSLRLTFLKSLTEVQYAKLSKQAWHYLLLKGKFTKANNKITIWKSFLFPRHVKFVK